MKASGKRDDILAVLQNAKAEYEKTLALVMVKYEGHKRAYLAKKVKRDLFRRGPDYWKSRWNHSHDASFAANNSGKAWTDQRLDWIEELTNKVNRLTPLDDFQFNDNELELLSYHQRGD